MRLFRFTYSGEAYVLSDTRVEARDLLRRRFGNTTELGLELTHGGEVTDIEQVRDPGWLEAAPITRDGYGNKSIEEIIGEMESK